MAMLTFNDAIRGRQCVDPISESSFFSAELFELYFEQNYMSNAFL
jgi:hypothetical protein